MSESEWTMVTLKEYFEKLLAGEVELRRARREDDLLLAHTQNEAMTIRLDGMNKFREQMQEERGEFVRSDFIEEQLKAGTLRHDAMGDRVGAVERAAGERIGTVERIQFKIIGGLVLATFVAPVLTGVIVYLLTRHAIPTTQP